MKKIIIDQAFELENGSQLPNLEIAYHTYGQINEQNDNVIWICHALTANSDAEDWWPGLVGRGQLYNPKDFFIICANILASPYGTSNPLSKNKDGQKYYLDFPDISIRDMVYAHIELRKHLKIDKIHTIIGGSIGSFQALEWAAIEPEISEHIVIIAGSARVTPWIVAFNETQRMAIRADKSFFEQTEQGGKNGLKAARAIALLSYRNDFTYNKTQEVEDSSSYLKHKAISYQQYQGEKLAKRFNAYSYYSLTKAVDSHNLGRARRSMTNALSKITSKTLIIGIDTDVLFPFDLQVEMHQGIHNSKLEIITSEYGHDGFLLEHHKIEKCIKQSYKKHIQ